MPQSTPSLKRKLRQLKKLEISMRFRNRPPDDPDRLIWNTFFSTDPGKDVTYPFETLLEMDRDELKRILDEFFYRLCVESLRAQGVGSVGGHDPALLSRLKLPPHAGMDAIKRSFRELAQEHHPDHGGDQEEFVKVLDAYERLTGKQE